MGVKSAIEVLYAQLECCIVDAEKFERGNDAAGKRVRACLMNLSKASKELRAAIQAERNSRRA